MQNQQYAVTDKIYDNIVSAFGYIADKHLLRSMALSSIFLK